MVPVRSLMTTRAEIIGDTSMSPIFDMASTALPRNFSGSFTFTAPESAALATPAPNCLSTASTMR
jgi:hypothetical protein